MSSAISATVLAIIVSSDKIRGAQAGFLLTFAAEIAMDIQWLIQYIRDYEVKGVALERLAEYSELDMEDGESLLSRPSSHTDSDNELGSWPSKGSIEVENLCARYGPDMPEILHDVSFSAYGGQRVGIVGATGGGKSTLAKTFFRFVDVTGGRIRIDDKGNL
jgi:ABC-type multidrug transport system fused ATPase/permease subunit